MEGKRLIRRITIENFLSFGPGAEAIELQPVNMLIGPNASGKSNVLETLALLRATPRDLTEPIRAGGGISEWLWKGSEQAVASIDVELFSPLGHRPLRYTLSLTQAGQRLELFDEAIEDASPTRPDSDDVYFYYRYQRGHPAINVRSVESTDVIHPSERPSFKRSLRREDLKPDQSVLSQRKDPDQYPEVTYVGEQLGNIRLYREWNLGRYTAPRVPQNVDLPSDFLEENAGNLALVLNDLEHRGETHQIIRSYLREFYDQIDSVTTRISGGTIQLFVHERGLRPIPATRLSDGTLRYLCLLAILCHPEPPPLICIEEPELGLHPDIIPTVARLLIEASKRTQLIVTTHSDSLVSEFTDMPECVLICEREETGTKLRRLDRAALTEWIEKYRLGELWRMGELGGNRW